MPSFPRVIRYGAVDEACRQRIVADLEAWWRRLGPCLLHVTNHLVDIEGPDRARGYVHCLGEIGVDDDWVDVELPVARLLVVPLLFEYVPLLLLLLLFEYVPLLLLLEYVPFDGV